MCIRDSPKTAFSEQNESFNNPFFGAIGAKSVLQRVKTGYRLNHTIQSASFISMRRPRPRDLLMKISEINVFAETIREPFPSIVTVWLPFTTAGLMQSGDIGQS